jgi:hypothetical protein
MRRTQAFVFKVQKLKTLYVHWRAKRVENVEWIKTPFLKNTRTTVCEVANMLEISFGPVQSILKGNLHIHQIVALHALPAEWFIYCKFLAKNKMTVIQFPSQSPGLAFCCLFLFPQLKLALKGRRFNNITMIQENNGACWVTNHTFHERLCTVVQSLVSLHKVPRTLLRGEKHWLEGKRCYREINSVQKPLDHTTCHGKKCCQDM